MTKIGLLCVLLFASCLGFAGPASAEQGVVLVKNVKHRKTGYFFGPSSLDNLLKTHHLALTTRPNLVVNSEYQVASLGLIHEFKIDPDTLLLQATLDIKEDTSTSFTVIYSENWGNTYRVLPTPEKEDAYYEIGTNSSDSRFAK